ncbi:hypothetical protein SUGI_1044870 [Cryptomeria japonica]|nr:hypothetical protein SUGI_1044870 [Cryptomeria japonica]
MGMECMGMKCEPLLFLSDILIERYARKEPLVLYGRMRQGGNTLIEMCAKCGYVEEARQVLDKMSDRDVASCTGIATGYARTDRAKESFIVFY